MDSPDSEKEALRNLLEAFRKLANASPAMAAPLIVPVLAGLAGNPDPDVAAYAIRILVQFGSLAEAAVPALADALRLDTGGMRMDILGTLKAIGPASRQAGADIFQLVKGKDRATQAAAAKALHSVFGLVNVDIKQIIGYDDYQSFLKRVPLPENPEDTKRPELLAALLATVPKDAVYVELTQDLEGLNHDFRREIAARLEPAMNAHVSAMPHDTYDEKKSLAKWVNEELRKYGLAVKCPKTGNPGLLVASPGDNPETGRFQIDILTPDGKRKRTFSSVSLPTLELTEASARRSPEVTWSDRIRHGENQGPGTPP